MEERVSRAVGAHPRAPLLMKVQTKAAAVTSPITTACRMCRNCHLIPLLSLGEQRLSGVFPAPDAPQPSSSPLELIKCDDADGRACGLVQLKHSASIQEMYGATYGYHSSLSPTMVSHLQAKADHLMAFVEPKPGDVVLDIGCNDGTLLNYFGGRRLVRVGIDPSSKKFAENFQDDIRVIDDFFSADRVREVIGEETCRIITSIAMLYDLEDPLAFMRQIRSLLARDGVWAFEQSYLPLMLTNLTYDQICHEHVTYFGLRQIQWMADRTGLKILDVYFNQVNGGSFYVIAGRDDGSFTPNHERIQQVLQAEAPLDTLEPFTRFRNRVLSHRDDVRNFLRLAKEAGKTVYGYGASTKGNIVLNFCGVGPGDLTAICDRNVEKHGLVTPGTKIPIIAPDEMRRASPDYLLVLIWHFRREVIEDEREYLMRGGTLVFDLPRMHTVDRENAARYLDAPFEELAFSL